MLSLSAAGETRSACARGRDGKMNFWLYIVLEAGLLLLIVIAIVVAFREATSDEPDHSPDHESS